MFLDLWIGQLTPQCLHRGESDFLVRSLAMSALGAARVSCASVVLLSAAASRIEHRLNAQRRRTIVGKSRHPPLRNPQRHGHSRGPARPLQNGACANNDLAPRVRGQSKPIKTMAYGLLFAPKIGHFASKFRALWAVWFGFFNSRLCTVWGPSLDRRHRRSRKPPPLLAAAAGYGSHRSAGLGPWPARCGLRRVVSWPVLARPDGSVAGDQG
jgi:hypothetical protein